MKKVLLIILFIIVLVGGFLFFQNKAKEHIVLPNENTTSTLPNPYADLIQVENLVANQVIQSPFTLTGQARGTWYFEASFPVTLVDLAGNTIVKTFAQAKGEWMTEDFVPFSSVLNFDITTTTQQAILILHNDNISGLSENDKEIRIPVTLSSSDISYRPVQLFYYNPNLDKDISGNILCTNKGLVGVERQIPITKTPIQDTIKLLLDGQLNSQEKSQGIISEITKGLALQAASLNNDILTLTFSMNGNIGGGSCHMGILWNQIEATAKQFPEVSEVRFIPEELFQP